MSARPDSVAIQVFEDAPNLTITDPYNISYRFPCLKCMEFWSNIDKPTNPGFNRSMSSIEESFRRHNSFNENDWKKIWKIVKRLLSEDFNPTSASCANSVSVKQFISVIIHFGCVGLDDTRENCFFLEQINRLIKYSIIEKERIKMSWFAGHMTKKNAEERLQNQPLKTFLVRFCESEMINGGFAVAIKANHCVKHYVVMSQPCCDYDDDYDGKLQLIFRNRSGDSEMTFPDLIAFVRERLKLGEIEGLRCRYVCPDLPFNADFRGYR